jgi:hypothetical protein
MYVFLILAVLLTTSCSAVIQRPNMATPAALVPPLSEPFPTPNPEIPNFDHIVIIIFENREFENVIGSPDAPDINQLANENTLLTQVYALAHPSLQNYIGLIGGDTYGYTENCKNCPVTATNLADLIELSGRDWKTYQEDMPDDCVLNDSGDEYVVRHNPFMYFSSIVNNRERCRDHVEEYYEMEEDIVSGNLPDFIFITPNLCNAGHDCPLQDANTWLGDTLPPLVDALQVESDNYLIVITWDEGETNKSCCGLPEEAGGRIATIHVSPQAKTGFLDDTPYTIYSLLRTVSEAWGLPLLGHAADDNNLVIIEPWK